MIEVQIFYIIDEIWISSYQFVIIRGIFFQVFNEKKFIKVKIDKRVWGGCLVFFFINLEYNCVLIFIYFDFMLFVIR